MNPLSVGDPAPDFAFPVVSHSSRHLSDLRGQPVLLAFSPLGWDPAAAEGLTQINRLFAQAGFSGELLSLSQRGEWTQAAFAGEQTPISVLTDAALSNDIAAQYGVSEQQALFVLDEAGIVRWHYIAAPGMAPRAEELLAGLQSLVAAPRREAVRAGKNPSRKDTERGLTRREFLAAALGVALVLTMPSSPLRAQEAAVSPVLLPPSPVGTVPVTLQVNGTGHTLQIEPRVTLLDALRERIGLTGSKKGCDHGQCGACTVHVNGKRINSCLALAIAQQGKQITTIEGLASGDTLHPMQAAFIQHDGFQCGFCTPGQIMSAAALLQEPVGPEDADVRENMSGNLCRCGAYPNIVDAIQDVRGQEVRKGGSHVPV